MANSLRFLDSAGLTKLINELDVRYCIGQGTDRLSGLTKLYDTTGSNIDGTMTQRAITKLLSTVYTFKGSVNTFKDLPVSKSVGDVYNILKSSEDFNIESGSNVAWTGDSWVVLSTGFDLTKYVKSTDVFVKSVTLVGYQLFVTTSVGNVEVFNIPAIYNTTLPLSYFAQCDTLGSEATKVINLENFVLTKGTRLTIIFSYDNTATNVKFKINDYDFNELVTTYSNNFIEFIANKAYDFIYNGTDWLLI